MTAQLLCTMGMAPSVLSVLPINRTQISEQFAANIMDHVPMANIMPFGMCMSPANPAVAAATAAAMGGVDADAVHARDVRTVGAGRADGDAGRAADARQHIQMHVQLGRRHQYHVSRAGADVDPVSC